MEVLWAGWRTTTTTLQQAGWQLSAEQQIDERSLRIAMRHADMKLYALSERIDMNYFAMSASDAYHRAMSPIRIAYVSSGVTVCVHDDLSHFAPIDAAPQLTNKTVRRIEDFNIFAAPMARTQEIIVDPQDVNFYLEKILELQRPTQAEIRHRNREGEVRQRQHFHAQILSFEAA